MNSPTQTDEIAAALRRIPQLAGRSLDGFEIEPLASLTNRNYKLSIGGEFYVLRIAGEGTHRYIDRAANPAMPGWRRRSASRRNCSTLTPRAA